jgi:hypothetical protein
MLSGDGTGDLMTNADTDAAGTDVGNEGFTIGMGGVVLLLFKNVPSTLLLMWLRASVMSLQLLELLGDIEGGRICWSKSRLLDDDSSLLL